MPISGTEIEALVCYVRSVFSSAEFISSEPEERIAAVFEEVTREIKDMARQSRPLSSRDRAVVSLTRPKTSALLADRVWDTSSNADSDIAFGWELPMEVRFRAAVAVFQLFERAPDAPKVEPVNSAVVDHVYNDLERELAHGFEEVTGATVLPLYSAKARRDAQYRPGDQAGLISIIDNINIVDEELLTWAQVAEFRRDKTTRAAYRRFVHWLDEEMVDKSVERIAGEVEQRLEQYEWGLRKHGIVTVVGTLSSMLSPKSLLGTSSAGLAVNLIAGMPIWSLVAAGGVLVGQAALSMATVALERRDIEMAHREIAYVQEINTRLGT